jgi:hypothetical protein
VAKSSLGKVVSRVGASGGGKTYAKARPANYYGVLVIIVVLGLSAVVYSRYERQHPHVKSTAFPAKNSVGYFALSVESCGARHVDLTAYRSSDLLFQVLTSNVVRVTPTTAATANTNTNLGRFVTGYTGMKFSANSLFVPDFPGKPLGQTFVAGHVCAKGTKYAGQKAYPVLAYWRSVGQKAPGLTTNAASVGIKNLMFVTFAFEPKGVTPHLPSQKTITAMYSDSLSTVTTTTLPITIPTTSPTTTTTRAVTTTTAKR